LKPFSGSEAHGKALNLVLPTVAHSTSPNIKYSES
jgi:hypothetical protein